MTVINKVYIDIFENGNLIENLVAVADEIVTGPIAMLTPVSTLNLYHGNFLAGILKSQVYETSYAIESVIPRPTCMNLNTFSYGSVLVNKRQLSVTVKDYNGNAIYDDQDKNRVCSITLHSAKS